MIILGISCYYHDAAAVIIKDGIVLAAAEEERFSRKKHDSDFPHHAIAFCLAEAGIKNTQIDYVVFYEKPFTKLHRIFVSAIETYPQSYRSFCEAMKVWLKKKLWIKQHIASTLGIDKKNILFCDHHLAHAASSFYPSPFEKAALLTIDGVGEWTTTATGMGNGNKVMLDTEIRYPNSIGLLYSTFTAFLGFEVNEGEWKVMGLAPYGKPRYTQKVWKVIKQFPDGSFVLDLSYFAFQYSDTVSYSPKFIALFGEPVAPEEAHRINPYAADIAASIQVVTEELLIRLTKQLHKKTGLDTVCLSGGVALNSVANYQILKESGFKNIFIQPAAGDSGGALGAALYVYHHILGNHTRTPMTHAYFGAQYTYTIEPFLQSKHASYAKMSKQQLVKKVAKAIANGKVIGWYQGKFEWGPRALGNRSILADARNPNMKDILNAKVKYREAFRPFAPSVLSEHAATVFDIPVDYTKHHPLRYMLYVVPVKKEWRKKVPAINHADNTARPQLVYKKESNLYHNLISEFYKITGVPLVLNTSFNLKGEPIVASPQDAYNTFIKSGIDILVLENYVIEKK